uniref:Uncharacterized protein n=1 Tax=Arundo donax TaxID=35708 RepID=A0A0A9I200_ARUDO
MRKHSFRWRPSPTLGIVWLD